MLAGVCGWQLYCLGRQDDIPSESLLTYKMIIIIIIIIAIIIIKIMTIIHHDFKESDKTSLE